MFPNVLAVILSYDSNMDDSRDNKKNRFSNTMAFMEEYLNNVLNDELPFHNEEKNKLTYEVGLQTGFPLLSHTLLPGRSF